MEPSWVFLAPMIGTLGAMLIVAMVVLLWPLSRRSAELIQLIIEERRKGESQRQLADVAAVLDRMEQHLGQLDERQAFTEALLSDRQPRIGAPAAEPGPRHTA